MKIEVPSCSPADKCCSSRWTSPLQNDGHHAGTHLFSHITACGHLLVVHTRTRRPGLSSYPCSPTSRPVAKTKEISLFACCEGPSRGLAAEYPAPTIAAKDRVNSLASAPTGHKSHNMPTICLILHSLTWPDPWNTHTHVSRTGHSLIVVFPAPLRLHAPAPLTLIQPLPLPHHLLALPAPPRPQLHRNTLLAPSIHRIDRASCLAVTSPHLSALISPAHIRASDCPRCRPHRKRPRTTSALSTGRSVDHRAPQDARDIG